MTADSRNAQQGYSLRLVHCPLFPVTDMPVSRRFAWIRPALVGLLAVALNVAAYFVIPDNFAQQLGGFGYLGVFVVTLVANATVVVPVPYYGLVARLAQELSLPGVIVAGAAGSTIGEAVAFFVGRSGRAVVSETPFYTWVQRQMRHPLRAFIALFLLAAPPNPAFDIAGLTAGAMGVPLWLFATAVFCGRLIRLAIIVLISTGYWLKVINQ